MLAGRTAAQSGIAPPPDGDRHVDESPVNSHVDCVCAVVGRLWGGGCPGTEYTMAESWASEQAFGRCHYTGERYTQALQARQRSGPGSAVIPPAHGEQALLEFMVMMLLCDGRDYWRHQLGISAVHPGESHIELELDPYKVIKGELRQMSDHALLKLLPAFKGRRVGGVPGLRVTQLDDGNLLTLARPDGSARLVLRGPLGTQWRDAERRVSQIFSDSGLKPLWRRHGLTAEEAKDGNRFRPRAHDPYGPARLGSDLLRRIALFGRGRAFAVRCWPMDGRWHLSLETSAAVDGHRELHDRFIEWLVDPEYGLPLTVDAGRSTCTCDGGTFCLFELTHNGSDFDGRLSVMFRKDTGRLDDIEQHLTAVGADPAWLERVLPKPAPRHATATRHATRLARYTGEDKAEAGRTLRLRPARPIAGAGDGQAVLESLLLEELSTIEIDRGGWLPGDPSLGIRKVTGTGSELTLSIPPHHLPEFINQTLPMEFDGDSRMRGIRGLRFCADGSGITLYRIGLPGLVHLRGFTLKQWHAAIIIAGEEQAGVTTHWRGRRLSKRESVCYDSPTTATAWHHLMSQCLRRIRILDHAGRYGRPQTWMGGRGFHQVWHIDCLSHSAVGDLAQALTDRDFGIKGLRPATGAHFPDEIDLRHPEVDGGGICLRVTVVPLWTPRRLQVSKDLSAQRRLRLAELTAARAGRS